MSESFANDTAVGSATFGSTGTHGTVSIPSVTVQYNATNQSYSFASPSGGITFTPADIDSSQSSAGAVVYVKTSGSTTDSLTVTRPGTSGPITYTYVGSAFWQHTVVGTSSGNGFVNASAYGVKTPDAALPRTGTANYGVDLLGAATVADGLGGLSGTGTSTVDFAGGTVITTGSVNRLIQGGNTTFTSTARIGANNGFTGDFRFDDFGTFVGTLTGRFYGPAAQEIGAAFTAAQSDGRIAVGTIMGRQGTGDPGNASFNNSTPMRPLTNSQSFSAVTARDNYTITGRSGGNATTGTFSATSSRLEGTAIRYNAATNTYTLVGPDAASTFTLGQTLYINGTDQQTFTIIDPTGPTNSVPTSYVRMGSWASLIAAGSSNTSYRDAFLAFGMPTANAEIVRTGTAGFKIAVVGRGADNDYPNAVNFGGKGDLFVDFTSGALRALVPLDFTEDYFISGRATGRTRGDLRFAATLGSGNGFSGTATMSGIGNYSGTTQGQFFGPNAAEIGGAFSMTDGSGGVAGGAFAGARDATVTDPAASVPRLADLTSATDLAIVATPSATSVGDLVGVTYDPASRGYRVSFQDTHLSGAPVRTVTLDSTTETAATTGPSYRGYTTVIDGSRPVTASILRPDSAQVAMSYASLGEFVIQRNTNPFDWVRFYSVFGIATPRMPSTGTANYSGVTRGSGSVDISGGTTTLYDLNGTSAMSVNFADQSFTVVLAGLVGTPTYRGDLVPVTGMPTRTFDNLNFSGSLAGSNFSGGFNGHSIVGRFFGPDAAEFGATFNHFEGFMTDPTGRIELTGAAVGKRP